MQFSFELETQEGQVSITQTVVHFLSKYKMQVLVVSIGMMLMISGYLLPAIVFSTLGVCAMYVHSVWREVSGISFDIKIDNFSLSDVINDLEQR